MGSSQSSSREHAWRNRLARFRDCGLTVAEFCRREGVSPPSFYQWRNRLSLPPDAPPPSGDAGRTAFRQAGFVPVTMVLPAIAEVLLPNGVRIRVPATDHQALRTALLAAHELCQEVA